MKRSDFRWAIEAGIRRSGLDAEQAYKLWTVADKAKAVGSNFSVGPGCPIAQAGLMPDKGNLTSKQWAFVSCYDKVMMNMLGSWSGYQGTIDIED